MKYAQLVIGPAGAGKSTYCATIQEHCNVTKRMCRVINLDPAAEHFKYDCYLDARDVVQLDEVMDHFSFGPNGALMFSMEYLLKKVDWLEDNFDAGFADDDFLLIDCPGQIELYMHNPVMRDFVRLLEGYDYRVVSIYCVDVSFISDTAKFIAGTISALASMIQLETPHMTVLTKCDLLTGDEKERVQDMMDKAPFELATELKENMPPRYRKLNEALIQLLEDWSFISYAMLNLEDDESIEHVLMFADNAIQYGENLEPKEYDVDGGGSAQDD